MMRLLLVAAALAVSPEPTALASPQAKQDGELDPARVAAGLRLAKSVRSERYTLMETAKLFDGNFADGLSKNPDIATMEVEYPGITDAMMNSARAVIERGVLEVLPDLWRAMADIYASSMTVAEIEQARAYYESPPGRRFLELAIANMDVRPFADRIATDPEGQVRAGDLRGLTATAAPKAISDLTADERAALIRWGATPAFAKMRALNPRLTQAVVKWANARNPKTEADVEAAMLEAAEAFMEAADKKKASK